MFRIACGKDSKGGWEIAPSEFWLMSPREWWMLYDINIGGEIAEEVETKERLLRNFKLLKARENEHN